MKEYLVHCGFNNEREVNLIKRYATSYNLQYWFEGIYNHVFKSADRIKYANFVIIWNGYQHSGQQIAKLCKYRNIPICFIEWGMLPQKDTFFIDPLGFCGDSILAKDLSWVTEEDMSALYLKRQKLQDQYKIETENYILITLQIENDTQILNYSHYCNMQHVVKEVERMYPNERIIVKPHPNSGAINTTQTYDKAEIADPNLNFFDLARKAKLVVSVTSTTLYEAGILGVPVKALGRHPLSLQPRENFEKIFAGALALNINRTDGDIRKVLERFNLRPRRGLELF